MYVIIINPWPRWWHMGCTNVRFSHHPSPMDWIEDVFDVVQAHLSMPLLIPSTCWATTYYLQGWLLGTWHMAVMLSATHHYTCLMLSFCVGSSRIDWPIWEEACHSAVNVILWCDIGIGYLTLTHWSIKVRLRPMPGNARAKSYQENKINCCNIITWTIVPTKCLLVRSTMN